ncbi:cell death regulator Aven isoform X2 [Chelonia mydas]|uniref:cell death regulator Aven isoform X2 n=1 Tax=Chelonia mydas TaxID=8469 RepID=UPI0018A237F7|nr:cell death regulator Aven isoform X2 [Chelonia mydas]
MQAERGGGGGGRPRRGGYRQGRRRPGGGDRAAEGGGDGHSRGGGGRGRGGAHGRGGGGGRGRRDPRSRGAASPPPARYHRRADDDDDDAESQEEKKDELRGYSKRKIVSNWNRYEGEDAEKEAQNESGESQRGTDFSVLLSSAGDSFTQFRFAEEKEWDTGSIGPKQLSALYVDCQSLVQALQELPLHLRLNVAAEMVQASTPTELPQIKSKSIENSKRRVTQLQPPLGQSGIASISDPVSDSVVHLMPLSKDGPGTTSSESFQRGCSVSQQEADNLDEELDLLLNLDAPVHVENNFLSETHNTTAESNLKMENVPLELDVTEEMSSASEQQKTTSKNVTEEELEDWLDSMIS